MPNKLLEFFPLTIDNSMFTEFQKCPLSFYRKYVQHIQGGENIDLVAGRAFATGIEVVRKQFYDNGESHETALVAGMEALVDDYGDFDYSAKPAKGIDRMMEALESYFTEYPLGSDHAPPVKLADGTYGIEYSFAVELPIMHPVFDIPLLFVGRADALVEYAGKIWLMDEKTTGQLNRTFQYSWDMRSQFSGYCWGINETLPDVKISGAMVRGVGLYKNSIKHEEVTTTRSDWDILLWKRNFLGAVQRMVDLFKETQATKPKHAGQVWDANLSEGCMAYFRPCSFTDTCKASAGDKILQTSDQNIWLPQEQQRIPLREYLERDWAELLEES